MAMHFKNCYGTKISTSNGSTDLKTISKRTMLGNMLDFGAKMQKASEGRVRVMMAIVHFSCFISHETRTGNRGIGESVNPVNSLPHYCIISKM